MNDSDFVSRLENDIDFFNESCKKLGEFYNLRHYDKVLNYISEHKGLIIVLDKLKPPLTKTFPNAKFDLIVYTDHEYSNWSRIILYVKVDRYTFDNGVMEDIDKIDFEFIPLMQELGVMGNLSIFPALYDW